MPPKADPVAKPIWIAEPNSPAAVALDLPDTCMASIAINGRPRIMLTVKAMARDVVIHTPASTMKERRSQHGPDGHGDNQHQVFCFPWAVRNPPMTSAIVMEV